MSDWALAVAASMLGYDDLWDVPVSDKERLFALAEDLLEEDE